MFRVLIASLLLVFAASAGRAQPGPAPAPMDRDVARCVLERIYGVEGRAAVEALTEACRALYRRELRAQLAPRARVLIRCRVAGDPDWIAYRLVTPAQCRRANGVSLD